MRKFIIPATLGLATILSPGLSRAELTEDSTLEFLYKYMPLPDRLDYSDDFYRQNIRLSMKAREEMLWGKNVPEREFLHFVVPVRVNNEPLDTSRSVFYHELKPRLKGMDMKEAVLEINHWCHEKITYRPSDPRTSSPLQSIGRTFGRCGEESTFTVAALRAMGIPARQIYTPRWAHTDDNHAWVEVWVDGKWHFIGACEPEPILDLAWFNAPAARGMLMNTDVFGDYHGNEEVIERTPFFTKINVTENYAPVGKAEVRVVDSKGKPVKNAQVNFCLYNYAEYFTLAKKHTTDDGYASFTAGLGDLVVWASDGNRFGIAKVTVSSPEITEICLDKDKQWKGNLSYTLTPPPVSTTLVKPTPEQIKDNTIRLALEDSIRNSYYNTFPDTTAIDGFCKKHGYDPIRMRPLLSTVYGNHKVISDFLSKASENNAREKAVLLLEAISLKDRSDITEEILRDHFATPLPSNTEFYARYVMNPRVAFEALSPYKEFFSKAIPEKMAENMRKNPAEWVKWVAENISVSQDMNPKKLPISPASVWEKRTDIDPLSRNILFVAGARSMGIPARIDEVTGKPQYSTDRKTWTDASFGTTDITAQPPQGELVLGFKAIGHIEDPRYYAHFTLSKINDGFPSLLEFGETDTWSQILADPMKLDAGQYILTSGQRLADGSVLANSEIFEIQPGKLTDLPLIIRQDTTQIQVIGSLNAENIYHDLATDTDKSLISTTGRGYYALAIITPGSEPSSHLLNDISAVADDLNTWGGKIMLLFKDQEQASRFNRNAFGRLPEGTVFGIDVNGTITSEIASAMKVDPDATPLTVIADTFNRIVYFTQGYTINSGERLISTLHKVGH